MSSYSTPHQKAQAQLEKTAATWLLDLINDTCWGKKKVEGPRPVNVKQAILGALNQVPNIWLRRPTVKAIRQHYHNEETFYFTGRRNTKSKRDYKTLVMVDIDCHSSGTLAGALAFAKHLADNYLSGMYYEPSTHGVGAHGYLIVEKPNWEEEDYNSLLGKLDAWLKHVLATTKYDVENVEIKGRCPVVTWTEEETPRIEITFTQDDYEPHWEDMRVAGTVKHRVASAIKVGTLAKMPRDVVSLYRNGTHETTANDLCVLVNQPVPGYEPAASDEKEGSCCGKFIETDRISKYMPIATQLLKDPAAVSGRVKVTADDIAIILVILEHCSLNGNADGSMPSKRIKAIWESLYKANAIVNRGAQEAAPGEIAGPWMRLKGSNRKFLFGGSQGITPITEPEKHGPKE